MTLSPDGSRLVFAARSKSGVNSTCAPLHRFDIHELPGTEDATSPFFSRDGKWIGFFIAKKLLKVPVDGGGSPIALADVSNPRGHAWGADDIDPRHPCQQPADLSLAGGRWQAIGGDDAGEGELSHRWPTILPDGSLLFSIWNDTGWESARVVAERAGSGERVDIAGGGGYPRYVRDGANPRGYLIYAQRFRAAGGAVRRGAPRRNRAGRARAGRPEHEPVGRRAFRRHAIWNSGVCAGHAQRGTPGAALGLSRR